MFTFGVITLKLVKGGMAFAKYRNRLKFKLAEPK